MLSHLYLEDLEVELLELVDVEWRISPVPALSFFEIHFVRAKEGVNSTV